MKGFLLAVVAAMACACQPQAKVLQTSPDGRLRAIFTLDERGAPSYTLLWDLDTIVHPSALGFMLSGGESLDSGFHIEDVALDEADSTFDLNWGENKRVVDCHRTMKVQLLHKPSGRKMEVEFRLFDDAMALRYLFLDADSLVIDDELTQFNIRRKGRAWWSYADFNTYEKLYQQTSIDSVGWAATPFICRFDDDSLHVAINEAAIVDYPDMTIARVADGFKVELTPYKSGEKARITTPFATPWRVVGVAQEAAAIVGSSTLVALAPPPKINGSSYRPMTYIGVWWAFHIGTKEWKEGPRQGATTKETMRYIDFAAANNIGGVVVEGWNKGWDRWGQKGAFDYITSAANYDLPKVAAYAKQKGVELIMHHETGADVEGYEALMDSAFALCVKLGIKYVKTGHAGAVSTGENHHGQTMVEHFARIVSTAAKYGLGLDMHEAVKGSGLERTWPNLMTREAIRGLEWEAWSDGNLPSHTTLIPFTRGLSGPADYTPGVFDVLIQNSSKRVHWNQNLPTTDGTRVHSTLAHQLALMVTIYSPLVMAADVIENYADHPAFGFVRDLDPDYDQSLVLAAEVGQYIATARRTDDTWYIGATTDEESRTMSLPLDFLGEGQWQATIYADHDSAHWKTNPTAYKIYTKSVNSSSHLQLKLAAGGGAAVVIKKIEL